MILKTVVLTELRNLEQFVKFNCYMWIRLNEFGLNLTCHYN